MDLARVCFLACFFAALTPCHGVTTIYPDDQDWYRIEQETPAAPNAEQKLMEYLSGLLATIKSKSLKEDLEGKPAIPLLEQKIIEFLADHMTSIALKKPTTASKESPRRNGLQESHGTAHVSH